MKPAARIAPAAPRGSERASAQARVLWHLLGERVAGTVMAPEGGYPGSPSPLTIGDLERHFAGEIAIAIQVVRNDNARVLAFDVDVAAPTRIPILAQIAAAEGFADSMIATSGSTPDKGKLIIFFSRPQHAVALNKLARTMRDRARRIVQWGIDDNDSRVEIRPTLSTGGKLRIGGRHLARGGPLEKFFNPLTGEIAYLSRVKPSDRELELEPQTILTSPRQPFIERWITQGLSWPQDGTAGINRCLVRAAHEAFRLYGADGERFYREWIEQIWSASPDLKRPSPKNRDARSALGWDRRARGAWISVLRSETETRRHATLLPPPGTPSGSNVMWHASLKVAEFVRKRGLNPAAFSLSYRELGRAWGVDAKTAWRRVQSFVSEGWLVILDRGSRGEHGMKTIFALPVYGVDQAYMRGEQHHMVVARREKHRKYRTEREEHERIVAKQRKPIDLASRRRALETNDAPNSTSPTAPRSANPKFIARSETEKRRQLTADASPDELLAYAQQRGLFSKRE